jgi:hypothetical protein
MAKIWTTIEHYKCCHDFNIRVLQYYVASCQQICMYCALTFQSKVTFVCVSLLCEFNFWTGNKIWGKRSEL